MSRTRKSPLFTFMFFVVKFRGNSLETRNVWVLSSFHPIVSKHPPPPQCLGFVLFSPRRFYRAELAATWKPRRYHVSTGQNKVCCSSRVIVPRMKASISLSGTIPASFSFLEISRSVCSPDPTPRHVQEKYRVSLTVISPW